MSKKHTIFHPPLMAGEGGGNTTPRSLMFPGELAHNYIMKFVPYVCTSFTALERRGDEFIFLSVLQYG